MSIRINRRISWFSRLYRRADIGIDDPIFVNLGRVACDLILTKSIVNTCAFIKARNITKAPLPIISGCYSLDGAAYINADTMKIKTAFSEKDFDPTTKAIAEVFKK